MAFDQIRTMMKLKSLWDRFTRNHPKFPGFIGAMRSYGIHEGTILGLTVTDPSGHEITTNIRVTQDDLEIFHELKEMQQQAKG